jgi:PKD repeat protein
VGYINQPIQFSDRSIGTQSTYLWDFGDSQTSTEKNPVHQYQNAAQYTVSLTINSGADQAVKTNLISILPDKTPSYGLTDGGDFESNQGDFAAETTHGFYGTTSSTKFELGNSAIPGKDGVVSGTNAYVLNLSQAGYDSLVSVHLYAPNFDFSSGGGYTLSFSAKYDFAEGFDGFIVEYSIDRGANWTPLEDPNSSNWYDKTVKPASFSTFNKGELFFSGTSTGYEEKQADISFLAGTPGVAFRFTVRSNDQDSGAGRPGLVGANHAPPYVGLAIDDFKINLEAISVDFETATLTGCTGSTLTFSDLSTAAAGTTLDSFDWDFGIDATPATATGQGPHDVTYSSTGLKTITLTVNGNVTKSKTDYVEIVDQILNQVAVTSSTMESCPGSYANIILENAESGAVYQLIDATTNDLLGEVTGAGTISIDIGPLNESITIKVVGVLAGSACTLEMDDQVNIVITNVPKPIITQSGETLTSSAGDSYQWFLDGQPIPGATGQSFTPIFIGEYLVQVTTNSCTVLSDAFGVLVVGLVDQELGSAIELYPNPASSWLTLQTSDALGDIVSLTIINTSGEMIRRFENLDLSISHDYTMDIASIPSGLYFLTIELSERKIVKKFIKY